MAADGMSNGKASSGVAADWTDMVHTGPGTLAGRLMRQFWQPVASMDELAPGELRNGIVDCSYTIDLALCRSWTAMPSALPALAGAAHG